MQIARLVPFGVNIKSEALHNRSLQSIEGTAAVGWRTAILESADGGGRTHTLLPVLDFESSASASSATSALSKEQIPSASQEKRKYSAQGVQKTQRSTQGREKKRMFPP